MKNKEILVPITNLGELGEMSKKLQKTFTEIINESLEEFYSKFKIREKQGEEEASKLRVYISAHNEVPDRDKVLLRIENILRENPNIGNINWYSKGNKWDSYKIKNAEIIIVVPVIDRFVNILGNGTLNEMKIALNHDRKVIFFNHTDNLFYTEDLIEKLPEANFKRHSYVTYKKEVNITNLITECRLKLIDQGVLNFKKDTNPISDAV